MSSNLVNLSAHLQETFPGLNVSYHKALSYMKSLCDANKTKKCLIVYDQVS
jgi:hypothetical protein